MFRESITLFKARAHHRLTEHKQKLNDERTKGAQLKVAEEEEDHRHRVYIRYEAKGAGSHHHCRRDAKCQ